MSLLKYDLVTLLTLKFQATIYLTSVVKNLAFMGVQVF